MIKLILIIGLLCEMVALGVMAFGLFDLIRSHAMVSWNYFLWWAIFFIGGWLFVGASVLLDKDGG